MSTMLQGKTYIFLTLPTIKQKLKMAAKEWMDGKMCQFTNDLLGTRLGGNCLLWAKHFRETYPFLQSNHSVNVM